MARVFDCFTFATELDLLEFRLDLLDPVVDRFVIVEAPRSHAGDAKPLFFADHQSRFERHLAKITHVVVDDLPPPEPDRWVPEGFQRDAIARGLLDAAPDDLVTITDVDEIPDPRVLARLAAGDVEQATIEMRARYFRGNWEDEVPWPHARVTRAGALTSPQDLRNHPPERVVTEAGAHLSYLMSSAEIVRKLGWIAEGPTDDWLRRESLLRLAVRAGLLPQLEKLLVDRPFTQLSPVQLELHRVRPEVFAFDALPPMPLRRALRKYAVATADPRLPRAALTRAEADFDRAIDRAARVRGSRSPRPAPVAPTARSSSARAQRPLEPGSVAIVVLNWNGWEDTHRCLDSLLADGIAPSQLVLVDNGSQDDSADRLAAAYPDVALVRVGENLGYAGGNNRGLEVALAGLAEVVVVLNNDTEVRPGFLGPLLAELDREPDAYLSPRIVYADEPARAWFAMATVDTKRGIIVHRDEATLPPADLAAEVRPTPSITGCCIAARRETWTRVGLFDEDYFLIFEDVDWCARANDAGFQGRVVTSSTVAHAVSSSFARSDAAVGDYYYARNGLRYIRSHRAHPWRDSLGFLDAMLRESLRIAVRDDRQAGSARFLAQLAGVRDHVLGRTGARRPLLGGARSR